MLSRCTYIPGNGFRNVKTWFWLIILFLKSHSCCVFPPSLSGKKRKISCSENGFVFFPGLYMNIVWTSSSKKVSSVSGFRFLPPAGNDLYKRQNRLETPNSLILLYRKGLGETQSSVIPHLRRSQERWNRHFGVQGRKAYLLNVDYSLTS